jgi:ferric-dicitrate binding protein FerR (iron transport regulator)
MTDRFWELLSKKLSSEANEAELSELEAILSRNPDLLNTAEALSVFESQSLPLEIDSETELAFERHIKRLAESDEDSSKLYPLFFSNQEVRPRKSPKIRRWAISILAVLVVASGLFILRNNMVSHQATASKHTIQSQVTTKPGSKTHIQLPDGSAVWLNASSDLTYGENFGKELREVNLVGEAFFDVAKDPEHPFIIHTNVVDVKVLGTAFNVRSYPNDANTETSVLRGNVEVTVKNREKTKYYLKPNEKVIVANNVIRAEVVTSNGEEPKPLAYVQPLTRYHVDSSIIETSWVENKLIFQENETFREVALKMERWYGVHIHFVDPEVEEYPMYGSFTTETVKEAMDALKIAFNFNYKINKDEIIISK